MEDNHILQPEQSSFHSVVADAAEAHHLPEWWVEAVAVEYLGCRTFGGAKEIWSFIAPQREALDGRLAQPTTVVAYGRVFHNVLPDVFRHRMLHRMFTATPVPLVYRVDDATPEGPIGSPSIPFLGNPIEVWDPKLNFSTHCQCFDEDGLWQWEIARFESVAGRHWGRWVSDVVDLSALDEIAPRLAELRNPPTRRLPDETDHEHFVDHVSEFYNWLDQIREPIRSDLVAFHQHRKRNPYRDTVTKHVTPPMLCQFEDFTVEDGCKR